MSSKFYPFCENFIKIESHISGTAYHNSYHACARCTTVGDFDCDGHHMSYPRFDAPSRSNMDFRLKRDPDHHQMNGLTREFIISPLENLPIDMVNDFVIGDSLHLLDLGITKRLLVGWKNGGFNFKETKLSAQDIRDMSSALLNCNEFKPNDFHRAIRGMDSLAHWKGTEYRTFSLYLGPIILKDILSEEVYDHYMLYFCAVTILSCDCHLRDKLPLAEAILKEFLEEYINIYGIDAVNNNVHNLCHLVDDVKRYGALPRFSAYPFENKLGYIKHLLRSGNRPLAQVVKRITEINCLVSPSKNTSSFPYIHKKINDLHQHSGCDKSYAKLFLSDDVVLENNKKNQWIMTQDDKIIKMINATYYDSKICIFGSSLKKVNNFFDEPIESKYLGIYYGKMIFNPPAVYHISNIKCKMICLKYHESFVFMPILHTMDVLNTNEE